MKKIFLITISFLFSQIFLINSIHSHNITSCQVLNDNSEIYYLMNDISNNESSTCFTVSVDLIKLDCQNHIVDGVDNSLSYGYYANGRNKIRLYNCHFTDWGTGVHIIYGDFQDNIYEFQNITSNSNVNHGFYQNSGNYGIKYFNITTNNNGDVGFYSTGTGGASPDYLYENIVSKNNSIGILFNNKVNSVELKNSIIWQNSLTGIKLINNCGQFGRLDFHNNSFYDNGINNNTYIDSSSDSYISNWNNTFYGNEFSNSTETDFSDLCSDLNFDNICDDQYNLTSSGKHIDYLPLVATSTLPFISTTSSTTIPSGISITYCKDNITLGIIERYNETINGTQEIVEKTEFKHCEYGCGTYLNKARCKPEPFVIWFIFLLIVIVIIALFKWMINNNIFD